MNIRYIVSMLEKNLQQKIIKFCKAHGILCVKVDSTSSRGWPDLTVLLPNGVVLFVELKTETGKLSKLQEHTHKQIAQNKGKVYVIRNLKTFKELVASFV